MFQKLSPGKIGQPAGTLPQVELMQSKRLERFQLGDTINGQDRIRTYCCPAAAFGPPPDYFGPTMDESGAETLSAWLCSLRRPAP